MTRPVLRLGTHGAAIGDVILHTPAIRAWKQANPAGKVIVTCQKPAHRDVLERNPYIDSLRLVAWRHRFLGTFEALRRRVLHRVRISDYGRYAPSFSKKPAAQIIGETLGIQVDDSVPEIFFSDAEIAAARRRIAPYAVPVAMHVFGRCTNNKLWSAANWAALVKECPEIDFVQVGLSDEPPIPGAADLRELPLRQSFAVMAQCRAFVGIESGPAHAAGALKIPAVVLFGPSSPQVWGHATAVNLHVRQPCFPCIDTLYSGICPYDRACMKAISVASVKEALLRIMASTAASTVQARSLAQSPELDAPGSPNVSGAENLPQVPPKKGDRTLRT